jgi:hypothetical protein
MLPVTRVKLRVGRSLCVTTDAQQRSEGVILRDWIKGQITAIETGILSFEGAFLGQILLPSGETVLERMTQTGLLSLPKPEGGDAP